MTRMSKQSQRRAVSPRKNKKPTLKTGAKKDNLDLGYKPHENAATGNLQIFIPKVRKVK